MIILDFIEISLILGAYATSADPLLKKRGSEDLPDEEIWRRTKYCAACPTEKAASKARKMADSPAHRSQNAAHNAAQKRKAAEMAASEDRVRCHNPAWSVGGLDKGVRSAPVSFMSTSHRPR